MQHHKHYYTAQNYLQKKIISTMKIIKNKRVCQNTLFITEDRYIAELSYKVAI